MEMRMGLLQAMETFNTRKYEGEPLVLFAGNQSLPPAPPKVRVCNTCGKEKPVNSFYPNCNGERMQICTSCEQSRRARSQKTSPEVEAKILDLLLSGMPTSKVAAALHLGNATVARVREKAGIHANQRVKIKPAEDAPIAIDCAEVPPPAPPTVKLPEAPPRPNYVLDWGRRMAGWSFEGKPPPRKRAKRFKCYARSQLSESMFVVPGSGMNMNAKPSKISPFG